MARISLGPVASFFVSLVLALAVSAKPSQSQAQDFVVTLNDSPNGLIIDVDERDSGERLFSTITGAIALNGDVNNGRKVALSVISQNSGPKHPIAGGAFLIANDNLFGDHTYIARVHRARPEEIKPATAEQTKQLEAPRSLLFHGLDALSRRDFATALRDFQKSADQGDVAALTNLAWLYENGKGVSQDYGRAIELYQKAADMGHAPAQANLAAMYGSGRGVPLDYQKGCVTRRKGS
jgi:Sel1 repeat